VFVIPFTILILDCDDGCSPDYSERFYLAINGADCGCDALPDSLENTKIKNAHIFEH